MWVFSNQRWLRAAIVAVVFGFAAASHAAINSLTLFWVQGFSQPAATAITGNGTYFTADIGMDNAADFDGGSLAYPGPNSPAAFSPDSPPDLDLRFQSSSFPDKATLDSNFPTGTYTATATNSSTSASQTTSLDYTADAYSHTAPLVNAASFNALQGLNPSQSITVNFNSMSPDPAANEADVFFTIEDASFNTLFNDGFLPATTTSLTIPANTLAPMTDYTFNLIFSDRINTTNQADAVFDTQGFDLSTTGAFTTGTVPEPASLALLALAALGIIRRHRSHLA